MNTCNKNSSLVFCKFFGMHIAPFSIKVSFYRMMQVQIDLVFLLYFYMTNEINSVLQTLSSIESRENDLRIKVPT